jgi:hypothetical protein
MHRTKRTWIISIAVLALAGSASTAHADFFRRAGVGLSLFNYRFQFERNVFGNGWDVNYNAVYNNESYNFGVGELVLNGAVTGSAGYTLRGIPSANFNMTTAGQPLNYSFDVFNGVQEVSLGGSIQINVNSRINALGFYDTVIDVSNRADYLTDGIVEEDGDLDFDVGPINVSGNIFGDFLAALTDPLFAAAGTENPFAKLSGRTAKAMEYEYKRDELAARMAAGDMLSEEELSELVNNAILAALIRGEPINTAFESVSLAGLVQVGLGASVDGNAKSDEVLASGTSRPLALSPVPEPTTAGLFALCAGGCCLRRRRLRADMQE